MVGHCCDPFKYAATACPMEQGYDENGFPIQGAGTATGTGREDEFEATNGSTTNLHLEDTDTQTHTHTQQDTHTPISLNTITYGTATTLNTWHDENYIVVKGMGMTPSLVPLN